MPFTVSTDMRGLKHIAGILLATVGVMFVLGALVSVFNPDPEFPPWMVARHST
jgi:hypothetical protein